MSKITINKIFDKIQLLDKYTAYLEEINIEDFKIFKKEILVYLKARE